MQVPENQKDDLDNDDKTLQTIHQTKGNQLWQMLNKIWFKNGIRTFNKTFAQQSQKWISYKVQRNICGRN